jgi:hypothetical protein
LAMPGTIQRVAATGVIGYYSYDHYGQMVAYGRMNAVIPGVNPRVNPGGGQPRQAAAAGR